MCIAAAKDQREPIERENRAARELVGGGVHAGRACFGIHRGVCVCEEANVSLAPSLPTHDS